MAIKKNRQAEVLAVINRKGGVGKTTTAVNLAHGLSRKLIRRVKADDLDRVPDTSNLYWYKGHTYIITGNVLLIDFDAQGLCARALGIESGVSDLGEVLLGEQHPSQAVISTSRAAEGYPRPNLWLLPASDNLERAKEILQSRSMVYFMDGYENKDQWLLNFLMRRLTLVLDRFSYIILDCAPGLDTFSMAVHRFAREAIVPVKPDFLSMTGTQQNTDHVRDMQLRGVDINIHTIIPTFYVEKQRMDQQMVADLKRRHGDLVGDPIPRSQLVAEAPGYQMTVFEIDPGYSNPATVAYQKLVDRVYYGQKVEG